MKQQNKTSSMQRSWLRMLIAAIVLTVIIILFIPWNVWALSSNPQPVPTYEEAVKRIQTLHANRQAELNPECLLQFLTHGQKVQKVIILVHGYTSCPMQFSQLGQQFFDQGYNV